jgi:hypothetical protein
VSLKIGIILFVKISIGIELISRSLEAQKNTESNDFVVNTSWNTG